MEFDAVIIGGGAAGLFCAIQAGKRGRRTLLIEHNAEVGRKIIVSGGGRCNFTNIQAGPENFVSRNPHFCKSALARYTPQDFIALVRKHKIDYYEKKLGQLFCRDRSYRIVEMLLSECERAGVDVRTNCTVGKVSAVSDPRPGFTLQTTRGDFTCSSLVLATGGLSFPKLGATDLGYRLARQFGLSVTATRPSLVPMIAAGNADLKKLAGISIDSRVESGKNSFRENILFTHRGLSGPAILQISNYWDAKTPVRIDLLPDSNALELLTNSARSSKHLVNFLADRLPRRFAEAFVAQHFDDQPLDKITEDQIKRIAELLNRWNVTFSSTEGYGRAEVTLGGVSTDELSSQTMESKRVPGLFVIGEVVDVTGWLGGYNFQWAWSSGFAAGQYV